MKRLVAGNMRKDEKLLLKYLYQVLSWALKAKNRIKPIFTYLYVSNFEEEGKEWCMKSSRRS